jgi:hypothetical protein
MVAEKMTTIGAIAGKVRKTPVSKLLQIGTNLARLGLRKTNPWFVYISMQDQRGRMRKVESSRKHLDGIIKWICRAQDRCQGGGVSAGYSFIEGWQPPYPETTGYIIPTFYDYAQSVGETELQRDLRARAQRMADWEIEIQLPSGAVQGGHYEGPESERYPVVFNTGQVILGWCRAFRETSDERYYSAARRAGDWLISVQLPDGSWRQEGPVVDTIVHAYDVRTAWSLLEVEQLAGEVNDPQRGRYGEAALNNIGWTLGQQRDNGWFENNAFLPRIPPPTHSIAYVMEGLIESERLTGEKVFLHAALRTAEKLLAFFEREGFMAGEFDTSWRPTNSYSCLTGNAQIAGVWMRLYEKTKEMRFLNAAIDLNNFVKSSQDLYSLHPGVRGGVKGSQPLYGRYMKYTYPNWAAKFLADSLMLEEKLLRELEEKKSAAQTKRERHAKANSGR